MMSAAGLTPAVVDLDLVRSPQLRSRMTELRCNADVLICDAESDADLATIVHAAQTLDEETVWAGSAGLVGHVAGTAVLEPSSPPDEPAAVQAGPLLFVVGSMSSVSRRQADALAAAEGIERLSIPVSFLLADDAAQRDGEWSRQARAALAVGHDVLITPVGDVTEEPGHALALRTGLAALVAPFAEHIGGLFVTGGETGRAVLTALGTVGLRLHRELEPGVPLSIAAGPCAFGVVTKAGAFGNDATLLNCRQALHSLASRHPIVSLTSLMERMP
jgi:4-hydroxythreonine-4-phosphate dehydrogenase